MARGIARRQRRSAWCSSPTSRPPSTGLCRGNSGGRFPDDMEPHPAGWGICALAVSLLLPPAHLPAQRLRQAAPPKGSIAAGATVQDSLVRRDVLLAAESTYAQQWKLTATAGQIVTIDLVSEAFDAYTFLLGPGLDRVVSSHAAAGALERARRAGVPTTVLADPSDAAQLLASLGDAGLVVLAGYLKHVPAPVVARFRLRMINIHPALLPAFGGPGMYGRRVHERVLASGAAISGATVHYVDEQYDQGPIIAQWPVPVRSGDTPETLAARVLAVEHRLLPLVVLELARKGVPGAPLKLDADGIGFRAADEATATLRQP